LRGVDGVLVVLLDVRIGRRDLVGRVLRVEALHLDFALLVHRVERAAATAGGAIGVVLRPWNTWRNSRSWRSCASKPAGV
jgi:hypothetical protein